VKDKRGTTYKLGSAPESRQDDPDEASHIFKWLLSEVRDTNDNYIKYEYFKDANQLYPQKITYTGHGAADGIFTIEFVRELRSFSDRSFATGFEARTSYRIQEIDIKVNGALVRKYALAYSIADKSSHSLLSSIIETGVDASGTTVTLPPVRFDYQRHGTTWTNAPIIPPTAVVDTRSGDIGVRFADVNGDGLVDIVVSRGYENDARKVREVWLNQGNGSWVKASGWTIPVPFYLSNEGIQPQAEIVDVNGDGLPDIVYHPNGLQCCTPLERSPLVYLNNGSGWGPDNTWPLPSDIHNFRNLHIFDINGDGLPDFLFIGLSAGASQGVYINQGKPDLTGDVWKRSSQWNRPPLPSINYPYCDFGLRTADVNGDGLEDIIYSVATNTGYPNYANIEIKQVWLNDGAGSWQWGASQEAHQNYVVPVTFSSCTGFTTDQSDEGVRLIDLNGDGKVDIIKAKRGEPRKVWINTGSAWVEDSSWTVPADFVADFYNNLTEQDPRFYDTGARLIDVNGDSIPDWILGPNIHNFPVFSGYGESTHSDLLMMVTYPEGGSSTVSYQTAPQYRDQSGQRLNPNLPFPLETVSQITNNDSFGTISTQRFSYEGGKYYFHDFLDRRLAGFAKISKTNDASAVTTSFFHQGNPTTSELGSKIGRDYRSEVRDKDGKLFALTLNKWDLSPLASLGGGRNFIKLTQTINFSYDSNSTHKDKAETFTYDDTNGNLIKREAWGEVNGNDNGTFIDTSTDKYTTTITYAANASANILSLPSQETTIDQSGNKVKESRFYYDGLALGSVNKGNLTKEEQWKAGTTYINTQKTYYDSGLIKTAIDPRGKITSFVYDTFNLYPTTVTNAIGQQTQYQYNYSCGKTKQITDPNGFIFQTLYDPLSRVKEEKQPDPTTSSTLVTKATYNYTDTPLNTSVKKTEYLDATHSVDTYVYSDGLGRILQQRKTTKTAGQFAAVDYAYNNIEQLQKVSLPYLSSGMSRTSPTGNQNLYTTHSYDALLRITTTKTAVGTTTNAYDGWKTTVTDPRGKSRRLYQDAYNRLVKVEELNNGSTYTTLYEYNGLGNLTKITDAAGNIRNFTYDGLGRRLTAQDLHTPANTTFGTWTYVYDDAGNLTQVVDPKRQTVNYTYDDINRVLTEDFTGQAGIEVSYTYDTCANGKGKLCRAIATGATTAYEYSPIGQVSRETKTITGASFQTSYTYDRQGNILTITNPDSSQVQYTYNSTGLVDTVQRKESSDSGFVSVVTRIDYGPHGKATTIAYANGTTTTNTYDDTKLYRLSAKVTTNKGNARLQDLAYTYDPNSNITQIIDNSQTNAKKTVTYGYDDLNRLTQAAATSAANGQNYSQTYTYDAIGNLTSKSDVGAYAYKGNQGSSFANPHAVTNIGATTYIYDQNGNLTSDGARGFAWDYQNRLMGILGVSSYSYDHQGQRVKAMTRSTTTLYPTKFYNTDSTTPVKHIFTGSLLVATIKGTGAKATVYSVHTDHLTGSNIITNSSGSQEELTDYYPFGDIRLDQKAGSFSEQRKFTGHEYDADTGLSYFDARYYNGRVGRFLSEDPVFLQATFSLTDPQSLNAYAYARNNPVRYNDPDGKWFWDVVTGKQSWSSFTVEVGDAANYLYNNSAT